MSDETTTTTTKGEDRSSRVAALQQKYGGSHKSSVRQKLNEMAAHGEPSELVAVSYMLPMNVSPGTAYRRIYYTLGGDETVITIPRNQNRVELLCEKNGALEGYMVEVDGVGNESNSQEINFTHEEDKPIVVEDHEPGVGIRAVSARNVSSSEAAAALNAALPAGHTGEDGDEDNPLGGDGTVEGTKVGPAPKIHPNPNIQTGVGTTIGSPPGTGTASLTQSTALRFPQ